VSKWKLPSARHRAPRTVVSIQLPSTRPLIFERACRASSSVQPERSARSPAVWSPISGLKTRRILFPMFQNKAEHFGERRGSQRDATVGGAVIEPQLI
jgi:hypothetical protein